MITSAANRGWPDDVPIDGDHEQVGLTAASVVRPHKIATFDDHHATALGRLDPDRLAVVLAHVHRALGYAA